MIGLKLALYGGSFNPLHLGHLILADAARIAFDFQKVIFVPSCISAHKETKIFVAGKLRYEMVKDAIADNPFFEADDCEIIRGGVSRTVDTLDYLQKKYANRLKENKISVIIGDDLLEGFYQWKNCRELAENYNIVVGRRDKENAPEEDFFLSGGMKFPCRFFENPRISISSDEIRSAIALGKSWQYYVPENVRKNIVSQELYGAKKELK